MTIHSTHPFADPDPDPSRRLRGRLTGTVALLTSDGAGLTVCRREARSMGSHLRLTLVAKEPTPAACEVAWLEVTDEFAATDRAWSPARRQ